ncbi:hypothetical protein MTO96_010377 [Rhipicephalus appendiculatus]
MRVGLGRCLGAAHIAAENGNSPFYCLRSSWCSHEHARPVLLATTTLETRGVRRPPKGLKKMAALPVAESSETREFPGHSTWQHANPAWIAAWGSECRPTQVWVA